MASRCPDDEWRAPPRPSGSTGAGFAARSTAARAAGELALAVLAFPGPPQLAVVGHLEQEDKMRLGSTCSSLRQASLAWFSEVFVDMLVIIDVASLAAWLERHQACLHLGDADPYILDESVYCVSEAEWNDTLTGLPPALVTSLAVRLQPELPTSVSTLTALTRLEFTADNGEDDDLPGNLDTHLLRPLTRLRHLSLVDCDLGVTAEELLSLPALAGLQVLQLPCCNLEQVPLALSGLTQLTSLALSNPRAEVHNIIMSTAPLATLRRLEGLKLNCCNLIAVPQQVSVLSALTRLSLNENARLVGGWQHLLPLMQLQDLDLSWCSLTAVPEQLSALTALTRLDFSRNEHLSGGWQHLLLLMQLQDLDVATCTLAAVPKWLSALTALTRLNLSGNRLESGWQNLLPLLQLQDLNMGSCSLKAVPRQLSALTALARLNLSHSAQHDWLELQPLMQLCDSPTALPEHLSALTALTCLEQIDNSLSRDWQRLLPLIQLQDLNLSKCRLMAVPEQVTALTALTRLDLSCNTHLSGGWQHLLPLRQLQDLHLSSCGLTAVPEQVSALTALNSLDLSYNEHLSGGWPYLQPLKRLRKLDVKQVPVERVPRALAARLYLRYRA
ncbi:Leucine-rich repeat and death domain-containing protein 1 [Chlorella vulgaris]